MTINDKKFESLIKLAAIDCGKSDVEMFNQIDTSDVVFDKRFHRKKYKVIRNYNHRGRYTVAKKVVIRMLICLMIVMSFAFMTVMAIEPLREALFQAVINQYEDHFTISFKPAGQADATTEVTNNEVTEEFNSEFNSENQSGVITDVTTESADTAEETTEEITTEETTVEASKPNDIIKEVRKPTWIPDGLEEEEVMNTKTYVAFDYYLADEYCLTYIQIPIASKDIHVDNEGATLCDIVIKGYSGIYVTYEGQNMINLFWNDNEYAYEIFTETLTLEEVIVIAESVK